MELERVRTPVGYLNPPTPSTLIPLPTAHSSLVLVLPVHTLTFMKSVSFYLQMAAHGNTKRKEPVP